MGCKIVEQTLNLDFGLTIFKNNLCCFVHTTERKVVLVSSGDKTPLPKPQVSMLYDA